jgi:hypothetical protein
MPIHCCLSTILWKIYLSSAAIRLTSDFPNTNLTLDKRISGFEQKNPRMKQKKNPRIEGRKKPLCPSYNNSILNSSKAEPQTDGWNLELEDILSSDPTAYKQAVVYFVRPRPVDIL